MAMTTPNTLGGRRDGAGRKPGSGAFGEPTQPIRIPVSQVETVVSFLATYRDRRAASDELAKALEPRPVGSSIDAAVPIPRMSYAVAAGFPSPATDYIEDVLDFNAHLIVQGHADATFVVRVEGWSMQGAGIHDGDEIVVDRAITPQNGHVVVAAVNGELVIKRLQIRDGRVALVSENAHFPPRVLVEGENLEIWGVATRVLHKLL